MLPISTNLQLALLAAAVFSASVIVVSLKSRYALPILVALLGVCFYFYTPDRINPQNNLRNQIGVLGAILIFGVGALWTWLISVVLGRVMPGAKKWAIQAPIAVAPAIILTSLVAVGQYVPNSRCSTDSLSLRLDDTDLRVPVEYSAYFRLADGNSAPTGQQHYYDGTDPSSKEALGAVCQLEKSSGGTIKIDRLFVSPGRYDSSGTRFSASHIDRACADQDNAARPICANHTPGMYENFNDISIVRPGDPSDRERIDAFQSNIMRGTVKKGDLTDGSYCIGLATPEQRLTCRSWRSFDGDTTVSGSSQITPGADPSELVAHVKRTMEHVISVITVAPAGQ